VFAFLESVFSEVAALFPFRYVHVGGDECPKVRWRQCPDCQRRIAQVGASRRFACLVVRTGAVFEGGKERGIVWDLDKTLNPPQTSTSPQRSNTPAPHPPGGRSHDDQGRSGWIWRVAW
jgi:hypothetical protein